MSVLLAVFWAILGLVWGIDGIITKTGDTKLLDIIIMLVCLGLSHQAAERSKW